MSDVVDNNLDAQVAAQQEAAQKSLAPLVGVNVEDGRVSVSLRTGVEAWQALGALEIAAKLIRNSYQ